MNRATELLGKFAQVVKVTHIVLLGEEAGATVIAALDQVQRHPGNRDACGGILPYVLREILAAT